MSNRAIYAILAIVALAAVGGFWLMMRGDGDDAQASGEPKATPRAGFGGGTHAPSNGPAAPSVAAPTPGDLPANVKEYAANGAIVRDHRSGAHAPIELDPNAKPPNERKLQPTLTKAVADRVRDVMHQCVATMPDGVKGENPRLDGSITISIKDKQVSVDKAAISIRDVKGEAAETTRTCIEQKALAITQAAGDEQDLANYDITLSFTLI